MEVFIDNRRPPNGVAFPENITPFPETADVLFDDRTAEIPSPEVEDHHHHSPLPPQKLRPIRCNGRHFPEFPDPAPSANVGLDGTLLSIHGVDSPELGFFSQLSTQKLSAAIGGPRDFDSAPVDIRSCAFSENGVSGDSCTQLGFPSEEQIKVENHAECGNLHSDGPILEAEFSLSSDDGGGPSGATTEQVDRKRKRKRRKKLEMFLENMMKKVMEKQAQMHNQLIEMIEKKERERIAREEAWKQMEIERAKRDEEARAQETSRNLALISFIQNLLGNEIQLPKPPDTSWLGKDEVEIHDPKDFKSDPSSRRWPKSEVQALVTVRTALDHKFLKGPKSCVWEEVAAGLSNMGYNRTAKKCKEKWENINKYYKRTIENGKKRPEYAKACPYFQELDILYKTGLINPGNAPNSLTDETEDRV